MHYSTGSPVGSTQLTWPRQFQLSSQTKVLLVGAGLFNHTDNHQLRIGIVTVDFTGHSHPVDSIQCPGRVLGMISRYLTISKTNLFTPFGFPLLEITSLEILEILGNILLNTLNGSLTFLYSWIWTGYSQIRCENRWSLLYVFSVLSLDKNEGRQRERSENWGPQHARIRCVEL